MITHIRINDFNRLVIGLNRVLIQELNYDVEKDHLALLLFSNFVKLIFVHSKYNK